MQINGGRNDKFVAYADSGALAMGLWDGSKMPMWKVAQKYVLADNFFMGAFGGSFFNHQWLVCACAPYYPNADTNPAKPSIAVVEPDGVTLKAAANSPKSAIDGIPKFVSDGNLTPDFYAVNTMQPPYQPSGNGPAGRRQGPCRSDQADDIAATDRAYHRRFAQPQARDLGLVWGRLAGRARPRQQEAGAEFSISSPAVQLLREFRSWDCGPGRASAGWRLGGRRIHQSDRRRHAATGLFLQAQGNLNEHSGYADIEAGDAHIADLVAHLEKSPQWTHMLVVVTYDENGGFWDQSRRPRATAGAPARASRPSSSHPMRAAATSITPHGHDLHPAVHHAPLRATHPPRHHGSRHCCGRA